MMLIELSLKFIFRDDEKVKSVQSLYRNCGIPSCKFQLKFTKVKNTLGTKYNSIKA
jgi:hypothetical protein